MTSPLTKAAGMRKQRKGHTAKQSNKTMAATILQWNVRGLRCNRRDFDILTSEHQPEVICLQETKLGQSPLLSHYACANYDCYLKSPRRNPDHLACGGVAIYIKKGLYHRPVRIDSHLQGVAAQVTLGDASITILSVYTPGHSHLTTRDLSYLTRNIRGPILITGDFNGHNYLWGSHDVDTRGEVIERFTDKHNLCVLNDGTHTYLKPQAQHASKPTSAIDLTIATPGLALRSMWEVLPDTHGSDHYPILTSILPTGTEIQPSCDPSHWVFTKANWERFHDLCLEKITEDILEEADPLESFVKSGKAEKSEEKPYLPSEDHRHKLGDSSTERNVIHGQNMCLSCQPILLLSMCGIE